MRPTRAISSISWESVNEGKFSLMSVEISPDEAIMGVSFSANEGCFTYLPESEMRLLAVLKHVDRI